MDRSGRRVCARAALPVGTLERQDLADSIIAAFAGSSLWAFSAHEAGTGTSVRPLIVAPTVTRAAVGAEILEGKRPRIDYWEMAKRLDAPYWDDDPKWRSYSPLLRSFEKKLRLDVYWAAQIASRVHEEGYDCVITLAERLGIPLAHMLDRSVRHVTLSHKPLSKAKIRFMRAFRTFDHWDLLLTFSQAEADQLAKSCGLDPSKVRPIRWGVDTEFFKPSGSVDPPEAPYIFSVGVSNRDYSTLIRAMRALPHIPCRICATSAWESNLGIEQESLPDNVRLVSYDHPLLIRKAYEECRFVVVPMQPTVQWSAGCTSVLQPQAMAKPVITTALPGLSEFLAPGETGLLVEPNDAEGLTRAIDALWRDATRAAAMGAKGREWVCANRSIEVLVDDIADAAEQVCAS